jgi:hypothetical protein
MVKFYCGVSVLGPCQANKESCLPPHPVIIGISALYKQNSLSGAYSYMDCGVRDILDTNFLVA